jgi:hypothetical protein
MRRKIIGLKPVIMMCLVLLKLTAFQAYGAYGDHDGPYGENDGIHGGNRLYDFDPENPDAGNYAEPDPRIKGWATEVVDAWRPENITHGSTDLVLGQPGGTFDVWSMGDGGWMVVGFDQIITNRSGPDFVVWENGFISRQPGTVSLLWAELMFVEVSSDGVHFARFPSVNLVPSSPPLGGFGCIDPTYLHNVAGKHPNGNDGRDEGTPFDLDDLADDPLVRDGIVDLEQIVFLKLVDVVGDGSTYDSQGNPMWDPYPTPFGTGGADLDAVAVLNMDHCPDDPAKIDPGTCGCGEMDTDTDEDGIADCIDGCPQDPEKITPGSNGCGNKEDEPNESPTKPEILYPSNGESDVALSPELQASSFHDPNTGDTHFQTIWQVSLDDQFSDVVMNLESVEQLTKLNIDQGLLAYDTIYYVRVRYVDNRNGKSSWSEVISFLTLDDQVSVSGSNGDNGGGSGSGGCFINGALPINRLLR